MKRELRLSIVGEPFYILCGKKRRKYVNCHCSCGNPEIITVRYDSFNNDIFSCKCLQKEIISKIAKEIHTTHGLSNHKIYELWIGMKKRCYNSKCECYNDYGGRGIIICEEWLNDFLAFYNWCIANGWRKELEIDRIDTNGNYEPNNCRFTTDLVQANNQRSNIKVTAFGEIKNRSEWCRDKRCKVKYTTLRKRINSGWNPEEAITTPIGKYNAT